MSLSFNNVTANFNDSNLSVILEKSTYVATTWKKIYIISMCVLISCGIFANILGACVLSRLEKSNPGVRLLKILAIIDITFLVYDSFYIICAYSYGVPKSVYTILLELSYLIQPIGKTCYTFEIYFTVLIACQRAVAVAKPLQASRYLRRSIINISIIVLLVFSILMNIPFWFVFKHELYWDTDLNITWISSELSDFSFSRGFFFYDKYAIFTFRAVIPLVILIVCNTIIIICYKRRSIQCTGGNQGQLIVINIAIILMSVITHVVTAVDRAIESSLTYTEISEAILLLNCSANFVFYCIFGRSFRKALGDMFQNVCCETRNTICRTNN